MQAYGGSGGTGSHFFNCNVWLTPRPFHPAPTQFSFVPSLKRWSCVFRRVSVAKSAFNKKETFHPQIELQFKEETSKALHLMYNLVLCWKWVTTESRSDIVHRISTCDSFICFLVCLRVLSSTTNKNNIHVYNLRSPRNFQYYKWRN